MQYHHLIFFSIHSFTCVIYLSIPQHSVYFGLFFQYSFLPFCLILSLQACCDVHLTFGIWLTISYIFLLTMNSMIRSKRKMSHSVSQYFPISSVCRWLSVVSMCIPTEPFERVQIYILLLLKTHNSFLR